MIRVILLLIFLSVIFGLTIYSVRYITKKQAFGLTKILGLSILSASLAILVMFGIVLLF